MALIVDGCVVTWRKFAAWLSVDHMSCNWAGRLQASMMGTLRVLVGAREDRGGLLPDSGTQTASWVFTNILRHEQKPSSLSANGLNVARSLAKQPRSGVRDAVASSCAGCAGPVCE